MTDSYNANAFTFIFNTVVIHNHTFAYVSTQYKAISIDVKVDYIANVKIVLNLLLIRMAKSILNAIIINLYAFFVLIR